MTLLLAYLFLALVTSFLCSIVEAVLLSVSQLYLKSKVESGDKGATIMLKHKQDIDKPLSAILSLNTIAHTVGAAGVGAQATVVFGEAYFGIVSAVLTLLILVLTEIIPKTIGANYNRELTGIAAGLINAMIFITYPLVVISSFLTKILSRKDNNPTTSREEISALASIGAQEGVFGEKENEIIQNLIKLKTLRVYEVMTPNVVVVTADEEMTLEHFFENKEYSQFSRIPVYNTEKDNITGFVLRSMVYEKLAEEKDNMRLKEVKRKILTVHSIMTLFKVFDKFLSHKEHIALVVDEYGRMAGIITFEDIIETLLGFEIIDEKDRVEDMQQLALDLWKEKIAKHDRLNEAIKNAKEEQKKTKK